ncbi:MAG: hypothetical protein GXX94_07685 [Chloroflexi bacterium]|nr:hypothetical protein [Chloroflexota bacterium]
MVARNRHTTVREVRDLALGTAAEMVAGAQGLDREVLWVTGLRATYPLFPDLDAGHLAIGSPEVARRIDAQLSLSYLINELARAQAAALVIDETPSQDAVDLANELGLPLFRVPPSSDLRQLERETLRAVLDREGQEARRAEEWRQSYHELLSARGAGAVVQRLAEEFDIEVELRDTADNTLQCAGKDGDGGHLGKRMADYPVMVAGRELGCIRVLGLEQASSLLPIAARQAAEVCALEMIQACIRQEAEDQLGAELVTDLVSSHSDVEGVLGRLTRQGYDVSPGRRHVAIALGVTAKRASALDSIAAGLESDLRFAARREGVCTLLLGYQDTRLCLVSFPAEVSDQRVRSWTAQAAGPLASRECRVAVSRAVSGATALPQAVQQALACEAMGRRMRDWSGPLYYADLGLYRLLLGLRDQSEVQRFYSDTLGPLVAYDGDHNTDLVGTLAAFFEQNTNASETARRLFIHRNTLNYRMQRISEIVGLDLDSADTRLALQVALRIHSLMGSGGFVVQCAQDGAGIPRYP